MKVEFYYSSKDKPGTQFPCDTAKALELLKALEKKSIPVKATDLANQTGSIFMTYNAAVTGPSSAKRSVFGAKGALEEDFGKTVPALLVYEKEGERYPTEVFPRMDRELNKLVGVVEAVEMLLKK